MNTNQYTLQPSTSKDLDTLKIHGTIDVDAFHTVKDTIDVKNLKGNKSKELEAQDGEDTESFCGTMIVNDTMTLGTGTRKESLKGDVSQPHELSNRIKKEVIGFDENKSMLQELSREEIEERLGLLGSEMEQTIQALRMKYSKNKEKILNAISLKKKNHQIFI